MLMIGKSFVDILTGINFIICGLEHTGTTVLSDVFRQQADCDAGFEVGVLLADSPAAFLKLKPYSDNIFNGWKIQRQDLIDCCNSTHYSEFYDRLYSSSQLFAAPPAIRFDKTPRYITRLEQIQQKFASVPTLCTIKDPRSIAWSDFRRTKLPTDQIDSWYSDWAPQKIRYMRSASAGYRFAQKSHSALVLRLEDICLFTYESISRAHDFVGLPFTCRSLYFPNTRTPHTLGNSINSAPVLSHLRDLPKRIARRVLNDFSEFDFWFYSKF